MACATMKRSLDFDPLHSPAGSPKRRRCLPTVSPSPTSLIARRQTSPFNSPSPRLSPSQLAHNICQEWKRIKRRKRLGDYYTEDQPSASQQMVEHSYQPGTSSAGASFPIASSFNFTPPTLDQPQHTEGEEGPREKEQPLFTISQVIMICQRMLKEQETRIKEEYDKVLSCKLAEQYDSFVRFNQDQMRRQFSHNSASYVS